MLQYLKEYSTSCIVVGSGAAGLRAAVECLQNGIKTIIVTKTVLGQAHSLMAEGGINAAIRQKDKSDSWKIHYDDTLAGGRLINKTKMVEHLCREAPDRIMDLVAYGAGFELDKSGLPIQVKGPSGGQTKDRVIATGDFIGFTIQRALMHRALKLGVEILDETIILNILTGDDNEFEGIIAYSLREKKALHLRAPCLVLASGGAGRLFATTTNPLETTGECYVLGHDIGIELRDLEMFQFHPTTLCWPASARGVLVTEAARGIGGILLNSKHERFMERYDERLELAPRDVVSRSIIQEINEGRGTPNGGVFLDLTHVPLEEARKRLVNTAKIVKAFQGIDITKHPIEVRPAAHHFMGGLVAQNCDTMECLPGIFVAGEVAWGTHGANRLGGNALAETQVFGKRAGEGVIKRLDSLAAENSKNNMIKANAVWKDTIIQLRGKDKNMTSSHMIRRDLNSIMDRLVGVRRNQEDLLQASAMIEDLKSKLSYCGISDDNHFSLADKFECTKMVRLAGFIVQSALYRKESRGAHQREDFPTESRELYNTTIKPSDPETVGRIAAS